MSRGKKPEGRGSSPSAEAMRYAGFCPTKEDRTSYLMLAHGLTLAFLITFIAGHLADQRGDAYSRPMSLFRDVEPSWIGYVMFALLIALGAETARSAARLRCWSQVVANVLIASALVLTALTSSYDSLHVVAANVAMIGLMANVAALLFIHDQWFWMGIHAVISATLAFGALANGYGVWQKGMILYFLATTAVLNHVFRLWMAVSQREELDRERWKRRQRKKTALPG